MTTEPTLEAFSALPVDVNSLLELLSTRVADTQREATDQQSNQKQQKTPHTDDENGNAIDQ